MRAKLLALFYFLITLQIPLYAGESTTYSHQQKQELADHAIHILGGNANVVARWPDEIRLALVADNSEDLLDQVHAVVSEVAELTGLAFSTANELRLAPAEYLEKLDAKPDYDFGLCHSAAGNQCANLLVLVSDRETVAKVSAGIPLREVYQRSLSANEGEEETDGPLCFFAPFIDGGMNIKQAFVYVRDDLSADMQRTCLQEEIYQSFGLFNDASGSDWFSFNNRVEPKSITEMDRLLLQTLYSKNFRPGIPAFVVVREFLNKL